MFRTLQECPTHSHVLFLGWFATGARFIVSGTDRNSICRYRNGRGRHDTESPDRRAAAPLGIAGGRRAGHDRGNSFDGIQLVQPNAGITA